MILVVDLCSHRLSRYEFVQPILRAVKGQGKAEPFHYHELGPELLEGAERVILSGSPLADREQLEQLWAFDWLKDFKKPVLGICAGFQLLGKLHGGKLVECVEIGMTDIKTTTENPLFSGNFQAYALHGLAVESSGELEVLARSASCVQAFKHKELPHYGVLFHPEVRNQDIIQRFCQLW